VKRACAVVEVMQARVVHSLSPYLFLRGDFHCALYSDVLEIGQRQRVRHPRPSRRVFRDAKPATVARHQKRLGFCRNKPKQNPLRNQRSFLLSAAPFRFLFRYFNEMARGHLYFSCNLQARRFPSRQAPEAQLADSLQSASARGSQPNGARRENYLCWKRGGRFSIKACIPSF
jgi:hypothetical protein